MIKRILIASWIASVIVISFNEILFAHSFSERYKSPVDISFVILFIFLLMGLLFLVNQSGFYAQHKLIHDAKYNILQVRMIRNFLINNILLNSMKLISISILILLTITSFLGSQNPAANLSPTFIWVIWWTGIGLISAFLGNVWILLNPWKAIYEWTEIALGRKHDHRDTGIWDYPKILDVWPAVILILVLGWLENVFTGSAKPLFLGFTILIYSFVTWAGMIAFGKTIWLKNFDPICIAFELLSCFAILEFRENTKTTNFPSSIEYKVKKSIFLRPLCVGLMNLKKPSYAMMVFITAFSSNIIYAAILEAPLWLSIKAYWIGVIHDMTGVSVYSAVPGYLIDFLGMLLFWRMVFALYSGAIHAMKFFSGTKLPSLELKLRLIWILVPFTIFVNFAHGFAFFLVDAQMIIPLISDPFGFGWDLFGTANFTKDLLIFNAKGAFLILVISIIIGGSCSAFVSNTIINQMIDSKRAFILTKLPLFIFFLTFMAFSILLISQPMLL